jgi:hypothetical protein
VIDPVELITIGADVFYSFKVDARAARHSTPALGFCEK